MVADAPTIPLQGRLYGEKAGDWQEVSSWWEVRGSAFQETLLPPLGVIVEVDGEIIAAMWCIEAFGIGLARLEFPCTKPGIPPGLAWRALAWVENAIVSILRGKGNHRLVEAYATPRQAEAMKRLGYAVAGENYTRVIKRIDNGN